MTTPARRFSRVAPATATRALIAGAALATLVFSGPLAASAETTPTPDPTSTAAVSDSTASTSAAAASATGGVALALSPAGNGVLTAGGDLGLSVEIANPGPDAISGTIEIGIRDTALDGSTEYAAWIAAAGDASSSATAEALSAVATVDAGTIQPGGSHTVALTVPAAALPFGASGVYGISAELTDSGSSLATTHTTIVWNDGVTPAPATAGVTVIAPITSVASATGLIQSAALEAFTSDTGVLTRELDAVVGKPVTIAVDPRIIVSIRSLGSSAPASAVGWLERLDAAPNPIIPLSYGDSDLSGEHQAGAGAVLEPTSFAYALKAANFTDVDELIEPSATAQSGTADGSGDGAAGPTPTPTDAAASVPTLDQLTSWDYTATDIAWPRSGSVVAGDLPFFAQSGLTTTILDSTQVVAVDAGGTADPTATLNASATTGEQTVLVADHGVSTAIQDALAATTDARRGEAIAQLTGTLTLAAENSTAGTATTGQTTDVPQVLAVLDRSAMNLTSLDQVLSTIQSLPWADPAPIQPLLDATPTQVVQVIDAPQPEERLATIRTLLAGEQSIDGFSSILADPSVMTGEYRADLLALLSNSWVSNEGGWNVAAQTFGDTTAKTLGSVQVVDGSNINMVANQANLPVTLSNELPYPVTVILHVTPSNGRLVVEKGDVEVTIEASSRKGAQIPLVAGVANGPVTLTFQLLSPTGVLLSTPSPVLVNVSADWETLGTVIFAALVVIVFGFGIVVNILRRRKQRRAESDGSVDPPREQ
ncbi:DUF6049 family protein [Herbiconiux sp.]|uniref:DUF6049 family protein n=1 Tax=Herbiconiux sp. TaxID=1871186 RepID=UPI0025BE98D7|nr:DUF6049 family protein [Herbiconiux sp.]